MAGQAALTILVTLPAVTVGLLLLAGFVLSGSDPVVATLHALLAWTVADVASGAMTSPDLIASRLASQVGLVLWLAYGLLCALSLLWYAGWRVARAPTVASSAPCATGRAKVMR